MSNSRGNLRTDLGQRVDGVLFDRRKRLVGQNRDEIFDDILMLDPQLADSEARGGTNRPEFALEADQKNPNQLVRDAAFRRVQNLERGL